MNHEGLHRNVNGNIFIRTTMLIKKSITYIYIRVIHCISVRLGNIFDKLILKLHFFGNFSASRTISLSFFLVILYRKYSKRKSLYIFYLYNITYRSTTKYKLTHCNTVKRDSIISSDKYFMTSSHAHFNFQPCQG